MYYGLLTAVQAFWVMYGSLAVELALMVASKAYYIVSTVVMQALPVH
jgi:hypothetical protein